MRDARKPPIQLNKEIDLQGTIKESEIFSHLFALEFFVATPLITMKMTSGNIITQKGINKVKILVSIIPSNFMQSATRKP